METILSIVCSIGIVLGLLYLLYFYGYANYKQMRALVFVGKFSVKNKKVNIKVSSSDGFLKRVLWLKKNSQYEFTLTSNSSSGNISVEILDNTQERIALLDEALPTVYLDTEVGRYYLVFHFENATGELELTWKEI